MRMYPGIAKHEHVLRIPPISWPLPSLSSFFSSYSPFYLEGSIGRMDASLNSSLLHERRGNVGTIIDEKDARGVKEMLLRDLDLEQVCCFHCCVT